MPRAKRGTRGQARPNPVGVLRVAAAGYGFVKTPEGEFFIPASKLGSAFDGDTVEVRPSAVNHDRPQPGKAHNAVGERPTGRIVSVVRRAHDTLIGRYEVAEPFGVVVPADPRIRHDIFTMHAENPGVRDGDVVRVRIRQYPGRYSAATGSVEEVVGHGAAAGIGVDAIVAEHNLRVAFPPEALAQGRAARVEVGSALAGGAADLRAACIFTIDPPDARDFDDALSIEPAGDGWLLGVHIADVSRYVVPRSPLDDEARLRATSVYLVDRVLPMLPEELSNGVCSLVPGEDRCCLSVEVRLDASFAPRSASFRPTVIRSASRLDYDQVQRFFDAVGPACPAGTRPAGNPGMAPAPAALDAAREYGIPAAVAGRLLVLRNAARALAHRRRLAGALDFDAPEVHMLLDAEGLPTGYALRRATEATRLVEQCMVLANEQVARFLLARGIPTLYRVHDVPDPAKLAAAASTLRRSGIAGGPALDGLARGDAPAIQRLLADSRADGSSELVSLLVLRAMKRAAYSCECTPHYGLGLDEYLHFTSPIRRYPDLVAHRALKRALGARPAPPAPDKVLAEHCSAMERIADEAAAQSQSLKLVEYLAGFIGKRFEGVVSRVSSRGLFVRLDNTAEGFVDLASLGEPFSLDVRRQLVVGQESGRCFRLGDRVRVVIAAARPSAREVDFELAD